jgi:hypothetical protein
MRVYLARKMTGLTGQELCQKSECARTTAKILFGKRMVILDPVAEEGIRPTSAIISTSLARLVYLWARDKQMIRHAHVVIDMTGAEKSEGVAHEIGYARYCLFKPVIRVYPELALSVPSVARLEDDVIASSYDEALMLADQYWGTFSKRLVWRLAMLNRCLPKWLLHQIQEFK